MRPLPDDIREQLVAYRDQGRPLGDCLEAAVAGDFLEFFRRADERHIVHAHAIAGFIHNDLPSTGHGSRAVVRAWCAAIQAEAAAAKVSDEERERSYVDAQLDKYQEAVWKAKRAAEEHRR